MWKTLLRAAVHAAVVSFLGGFLDETGRRLAQKLTNRDEDDEQDEDEDEEEDEDEDDSSPGFIISRI